MCVCASLCVCAYVCDLFAPWRPVAGSRARVLWQSKMLTSSAHDVRAAQVVKANLPVNLVREDEAGPACPAGIEAKDVDTNPQGLLQDQRFLYSPNVSIPHLEPVEEDHDWYSEGDCLLPSGQDTKAVTGAEEWPIEWGRHMCKVGGHRGCRRGVHMCKGGGHRGWQRGRHRGLSHGPSQWPIRHRCKGAQLGGAGKCAADHPCGPRGSNS